MTHPIDEQKDLETILAAIRRWENAPRIEAQLTPYEGWTTMAGLQLCLRHPELPPDLQKIMTRVGRRLQALVCDIPEIDDIAERGWNPDHDQPGDQIPCNLELPPGELQVAPHRDAHPEPSVDDWRQAIVPATALNYRDKLTAMFLAVLACRRTLEADVDVTQLAALADLATASVREALARLTGLQLIIDVTGPGVGPDAFCYRLTIPTDQTVLYAPEQDPR